MAQTQGQSRYDREYRGARRKIKLVLGILVLLVLTFRFVIGFSVVRGEGMSPTYTRGRPLVYLRIPTEYKRSDIVLVELPDGTSAPLRVLGVAGDLVDVRDGFVSVNAISERGNYSFTRTDPHPDGPVYPLILRQGELFVLDLSFLGWYLLRIVPMLGFASRIWSVPYIATTKALFYERLRGNTVWSFSPDYQ